MMLRTPLLAVLFVLFHQTHAQVDTLVDHYLTTITQKDLRAHLEVLASDAYEGRETGAKGQKMAAEYLRTSFGSMGIGPVPDWQEKGLLAPGYEQPFLLELIEPGALRLEVSGLPQRFMQDYFYFSERTDQEVTAQEVVFMGLGEKNEQRNDYQDVDVKDKVVLVLEGDGGKVAKDAVPDNVFFTDLSRR